jgi:hypothetical protein
MSDKQQDLKQIFGNRPDQNPNKNAKWYEKMLRLFPAEYIEPV